HRQRRRRRTAGRDRQRRCGRPGIHRRADLVRERSDRLRLDASAAPVHRGRRALTPAPRRRTASVEDDVRPGWSGASTRQPAEMLRPRRDRSRRPRARRTPLRRSSRARGPCPCLPGCGRG
ncbi:MAG: hypothetical protein EOP08_13895, partial [Proteobacteria bacterium]